MNKLNNKGFLSVTTIISFVLVFITILVLIMVTYTNNRKIFNIYKSDIKNVLLDKRKVNKALSSLFESPSDSSTLPGKSYDYLVSDNVKSISYDSTTGINITYVDSSENNQTYTNTTVDYFSVKDYIHNKKFVQNQNKLLQVYEINNDGNYTFDEDNYYIEELNETVEGNSTIETIYQIKYSMKDLETDSIGENIITTNYVKLFKTTDSENKKVSFSCAYCGEEWQNCNFECKEKDAIETMFISDNTEVQE